MNIKYPKTEVLAVLGSKVYPLYVTADVDEITDDLQFSHREDFLTFETAIKKSHGQGLWYPGCGEEPFWTNWTVKKNAIKSYVSLPEPKVSVDYGYDPERF